MKTLSFSQRIGKKPAFKGLQIETIDKDLLNMLWNTILDDFFRKITAKPGYNEMESPLQVICSIIWKDFFINPIDEIPANRYGVAVDSFLAYIKNWIYNAQWDEVYELIEFLSSLERASNSYVAPYCDFSNECNRVLEKGASGYRIIDGKVVQITYEPEIREIEEAIASWKQVSLHLKEALNKLSDRKNPDFRNSIKESISAVEACCRVITSENTLGSALKKLENSGVKINKQLSDGFEKIYAYTNGKDTGIRHAIIEEGIKIDFDDAKYMLVSCSAFVNYLIAKAQKAGIQIK